MAVTIKQLAVSLRILAELTEDLPDGLNRELGRVLAFSKQMVLDRAPTAPTAYADEAVVRIAGYLFDQPTAPGGSQWANAYRNSGAASVLGDFTARRALPIGGEDEDPIVQGIAYFTGEVPNHLRYALLKMDGDPAPTAEEIVADGIVFITERVTIPARPANTRLEFYDIYPQPTYSGPLVGPDYQALYVDPPEPITLNGRTYYRFVPQYGGAYEVYDEEIWIIRVPGYIGPVPPNGTVGVDPTAREGVAANNVIVQGYETRVGALEGTVGVDQTARDAAGANANNLVILAGVVDANAESIMDLQESADALAGRTSGGGSGGGIVDEGVTHPVGYNDEGNVEFSGELPENRFYFIAGTDSTFSGLIVGTIAGLNPVQIGEITDGNNSHEIDALVMGASEHFTTVAGEMLLLLTTPVDFAQQPGVGVLYDLELTIEKIGSLEPPTVLNITTESRNLPASKHVIYPAYEFEDGATYQVDMEFLDETGRALFRRPIGGSRQWRLPGHYDIKLVDGPLMNPVGIDYWTLPTRFPNYQQVCWAPTGSRFLEAKFVFPEGASPPWDYVVFTVDGEIHFPDLYDPSTFPTGIDSLQDPEYQAVAEALQAVIDALVVPLIQYCGTGLFRTVRLITHDDQVRPRLDAIDESIDAIEESIAAFVPDDDDTGGIVGPIISVSNPSEDWGVSNVLSTLMTIADPPPEGIFIRTPDALGQYVSFDYASESLGVIGLIFELTNDDQSVVHCQQYVSKTHLFGAAQAGDIRDYPVLYFTYPAVNNTRKSIRVRPFVSYATLTIRMQLNWFASGTDNNVPQPDSGLRMRIRIARA